MVTFIRYLNGTQVKAAQLTVAALVAGILAALARRVPRLTPCLLVAAPAPHPSH